MAVGNELLTVILPTPLWNEDCQGIPCGGRRRADGRRIGRTRRRHQKDVVGQGRGDEKAFREDDERRINCFPMASVSQATISHCWGVLRAASITISIRVAACRSVGPPFEELTTGSQAVNPHLVARSGTRCRVPSPNCESSSNQMSGSSPSAAQGRSKKFNTLSRQCMEGCTPNEP